MSLNGLDNPELQQAFEYACAEAGWFFLRYASRDQIELLGKGNSGVREMKDLVQKEPDDSPLYGFIRYRRRNILIKLVPDGTTRVLKARSQVHFNSVIERFTPCDVTVSLTSARELTDAALTTACSTHTATASISSSSSSLRQRRLTDIVESAEEGQDAAAGEQKVDEKTTVNSQGLQVVVTTHEPAVSSDGTRGPIAVEISRPEPIKIEDEIVTKYADIDDAKTNPSTTPPKRDTSETLRRKSTSSARPAQNEIYDYLYKPKVKLGPRPSADWDRRPHTSAASSKGFSVGSGESRPVASVPKSIHIPSRKLSSHRSSNSKHTTTDSSTNNPVIIVPPTPTLPLQPAAASSTLTTPSTYSPILLSPTLSIASVRTTKSSSVSLKSSKQPAITPEKARLLKALELRKKAMTSKAEAQARAEAEEASRQQQILEQQKEEEERKNKGELAHPEKINDHGSTTEDEKPTNTHDHENDSDGSNESKEDSKNNSNTTPSNLSSSSSGSNLNNNDNRDDDDGNHADADDSAEDNSATPIPSTPARASDAAQDVPDTQNPIIAVESDGEQGNSGSAPEYDPFSSISEDDNASLSQPDTNSTLDTVGADEGIMRMKSEPTSLKSASTSDLTGSKENLQLRRVDTSPSPLAPSKKSHSQKARTHHARLPSTEVPVIETARSVSAPFLGGAPSDTKPVLLSPRKVNVSAGSVSQRIRQLEMLSTRKKQPPSPALTPPRSRPSSPNPAASLPSLRTAGLKTSPSSTTASAASSTTVTPQKIESPFLHAIQKSPDFLLPNYGPDERIRKLSSPEMPPLSFRKNSISELLTPKTSPASNGIPVEDKKPIPTVPRPRSKSSSGTAPRKNSIPPPPVPPVPQLPVVLQPSKPAAVEKSVLLMGWVNVQLPDAIIWKRRCLKVDSDGWLFLSVTEDEHSPQTRKWNIPQDVSRIVIPDTDEQELPNSVHILLKEGGILQCACQDLQEQGEVFKSKNLKTT